MRYKNNDISEIPLTGISKRVSVPFISTKKMRFYSHGNGCAPEFALIKRLKTTKKWTNSARLLSGSVSTCPDILTSSFRVLKCARLHVAKISGLAANSPADACGRKQFPERKCWRFESIRIRVDGALLGWSTVICRPLAMPFLSFLTPLDTSWLGSMLISILSMNTFYETLLQERSVKQTNKQTNKQTSKQAKQS